VRRLDSLSAFFDGFRELFIRLRMLDTPSAQKCDQAFGNLLRCRDRDDANERPTGFHKNRGLTPRMHPLHQVRKTASGILDRHDGFTHMLSLP
jgi:hypothetical protein